MSNLTSPGHVTSLRMEAELISYETMSKILETNRFIVVPIVSAPGMMGNLFSAIVLFKHGFRKSSNIILFVLAITDLTTLVSVYKDFMFGRGNAQTDKSTAEIWYAFWLMFRMFGKAAEYTSLCIPSVITIERLVAVFLPLRFPLIVTPLKMWLTLGVLYGLWFAKFLHSTVFFHRLQLKYDPVMNLSRYGLVLTEYYLENYNSYYQINYLVIIIGSTVPAVLTAVGCFIISIKLRINSHKRKKMTKSSKAKSTSQTTRTLLAVCFVYLVMCTYKWILNIPQIEDVILNRSGVGLLLTNVGYVFYEVLALLSTFNNSFNFVVYVCLNRKFRDTFKTIFVCPGVSSADDRGKKASENQTTVNTS